MAAWKKTGKLLAHRERLINGFQQKGIPAEFAEALFKQIQGFGEYGFPESHAASFALLVYLSAWQKAHFPAHFAAALLNSQPMGFYSASSIVRDAQAHAVKVLKVCVSQSEWDCTLEDAEFASELCDNPTQRDNSMPCKQPLPQVLTKSLRLGLRLVSGLGQPAAERISAARKDGAYASLKDLARRAQLKKRELETLAEAGALETLIADRRQALWSVRREQDLGLWASVDVAEPVVPLRELSRVEKLVFDYQRVGLSIADHPVKHVRIALCKRGVITAKQVNEIPHGSRACMAGLVLNRQRPATARGVTFMTLEDETGVVNVVVFRRVWERFAYVATHESFVQVSGKVERQVTSPRPGEVGRATPVVHLVAYALEPFLEAPGSQLRFKSRDFR
jgi:error-prone DNA polymerase